MHHSDEVLDGSLAMIEVGRAEGTPKCDVCCFHCLYQFLKCNSVPIVGYLMIFHDISTENPIVCLVKSKKKKKSSLETWVTLGPGMNDWCKRQFGWDDQQKIARPGLLADQALHHPR